MEDQGLRGRGSRIHSAFLPQSFRPRHLRAAWQIHSKHSPDVHAWLWLWRAALSSSSALRAGAGKQGHRNAAGPVLTVPAKEGQTAQERAMRPRQLDSIQGLRSARQCRPRSIPGVRSPWAELILPRKKPRAEEKVKGPNPHLQPPRLYERAAACHQHFAGSCSVRRRSSANPPVHDTTSQQGGFETIFKTFRTSIEEPEPLP